MNLDKTKIDELNGYLEDPSLNIPDFRRKVTATGSNYLWLQKNIKTKNPGISPRVLELLQLKPN